MSRLTHPLSLPFLAVLMLAADPTWKDKQISQWDERDANQVLAGSPWVKRIAPTLLRQLNEAQLRDAGRMGGGKGVGLDRKKDDSKPRAVLTVRWESALPVRTAELKAGEQDAPDWDGDYYAIAIYDVPGLKPADQKNTGELKRTAVLRREGKKDLKPVRVDVVLFGAGMARLVYLFPRSVKLTAADPHILFVAQIGRLYLAPIFDTAEMQLDGKLEL